MRKLLSCRCLAFAVGAMALLPNLAAAQTDCEWNPDFEQDYAIGITDILAILGIFGAVDNDQDGLWDVNDLCEDTTACNYDANPTEACLYEDALGVCGGERCFLSCSSVPGNSLASPVQLRLVQTHTAMLGTAVRPMACKVRSTTTSIHVSPRWVLNHRLQRIHYRCLRKLRGGCIQLHLSLRPIPSRRRNIREKTPLHCSRGNERAHALSSEPTMPVWCMTLSRG